MAHLQRRMAGAALAVLVLSCGQKGTTTRAGDSASSSASGAPTVTVIDAPTRLAALRAAEQRRNPAEVSRDDQSSRDVSVRRAAARALARIASPGARAGLLRALSDEDGEVVAWAAYGLGASCDGVRNETVGVLAARSLDLPPEPANGPSALRAIARAIGRCASDKSEPTLFAWLGGSAAEASAACYGLGDLAGDKKRLREETIASLLNLAAGSPSVSSVPDAFFPLARVDNVPPSVTTRLFDVASERIKEASPFRLFAIRALSRAKQPAIPVLRRITSDASFSSEERVEAVRMLARIGHAGLGAIADEHQKSAVDVATVVSGGPGFEVPMTMLGALASTRDPKLLSSLAPILDKLASLVPEGGASDAEKRRVSLVRCGAARISARGNVSSPALVACDLTEGSIGSRTMVAVIDADDVIGTRLASYTKTLASKDARTREAAVELLATHSEIPDAPKILTDALSATEVGVVEQAADVVSKAPDRASPTAPRKAKDKNDKTKKEPKDPTRPDPEEPRPEPSKALVVALEAALARADKTQDPELAEAVIAALGALQDKSVVPALGELCKSTYPMLREPASQALGLIKGVKHPCPSPETAGPDPPELASTLGATTLVFSTDAGELRMRLDPTLAPVTVARIADLVKSGYYAGNVIHRVEPSYVVQFGSPHADGAGGPDGRQPLRNETTPLPFERFSVGIALAGPDTGSSQLFVTRIAAPQLDGVYSLIGTASGAWDRVTEGDVIVAARVEDSAASDVH